MESSFSSSVGPVVGNTSSLLRANHLAKFFAPKPAVTWLPAPEQLAVRFCNIRSCLHHGRTCRRDTAGSAPPHEASRSLQPRHHDHHLPWWSRSMVRYFTLVRPLEPLPVPHRRRKHVAAEELILVLDDISASPHRHKMPRSGHLSWTGERLDARESQQEKETGSARHTRSEDEDEEHRFGRGSKRR
jgi:hypothetical protein